MSTVSFLRGLRRGLAASILVGLAGCGGGDFTELFVKLVTARFVPAPASAAAGSSAHVELEVTCDYDALNTAFGRLGIRVKLDPSHTLAAGVTATLAGTPDAQGYSLFPCSSPTSDPELRVAHLPVTIVVAAGTPALSTTLEAYVEVEPFLDGEPSKDSTSAQLPLTTTVGNPATPAAPGPG